MINYYVPDPEFLATYNMGKDTVEQIATQWFGYPTQKVKAAGRTRDILVPETAPIVLAVINLAFSLSYIAFVTLGGFKKCHPYFRRMLVWMLVIWLTNFVFSVLASPIVLRYQVFPMIVTFTFLAMLQEFLIRFSFTNHKTEYYEKDIDPVVTAN